MTNKTIKVRSGPRILTDKVLSHHISKEKARNNSNWEVERNTNVVIACTSETVQGKRKRATRLQSAESLNFVSVTNNWHASDTANIGP